MKLIGGSLISVIAIIVWLAAWTIGEPPSISVFWQRAEVTIVNHETRGANDGWGVVERTDPLIEIEEGFREGRTVRLIVGEAVGDRDAAIDAWPVGQTLTARISPGGNVAYPASLRPALLIPAVAVTILFAFLAYIGLRPWLESRWRAQDGPTVRRNAGSSFRPFALLFGFIFTAVPLLLAYFLWTFGDPPPYSIAWPRSEMTVSSSAVRPIDVGNGTRAAYVDVTVVAPGSIDNGGEALQGTTWGWIPIPEAEELVAARYRPGETVRAMRSPEGSLYVVRWRFSDFLALLILPLGLITLPIGLFAFRLGTT